MITKKRKVSQIPSTTVLTQDSKILIVQNGTTATISALDILAGVSGISAAHLVDFNNPHQVTKAQIGLGNVDNTSDANKPVSTLVQSALNLKQDVLVSGTNIKTINGVSILGSGNIDLSSVAAVTSVNSKVGAVVLTTADISENSNLYYTNARVKAYADTLYPSLTGSYSNPSWITSIAWAKLSGTPTSLSGYGITDPVVFSNTVYGNPAFIGTLAWSKLIGTPTTLSGYGITDALTMTRTITINGVTQDLTSNRTWNVGDIVSSGSYNNPSWITSLNWNKIASTPTTLSGYGITDGVSTSGSYSNPSWITDLAFSKITGYSVPTLAQVTTAGATTTNAITVGGLTVATNLIYTDTVNGRVGIGTSSPTQLLEVAGNIKLSNNSQILWRNAANNGDIPIFQLTSTNDLNIGTTSSSVPSTIRLHTGATERLRLFQMATYFFKTVAHLQTLDSD